MPSCSPIIAHRFIPALLLACTLAACGAPAASAPTTAPAPTNAPAPTAAPAAQAPTAAAAAGADLDGIKRYLQENANTLLKAGADEIKADANSYYDLVKAANFDYKQAWGDGSAIRPLLANMREQFNTAHTGYENIEGIVAGVPSLSNFDTLLDAGASGAEGGDNVADFTLTLPDGSKLEKPGNLFHILLEPMIYGSDPAQSKFAADLDNDGKLGFGDQLPDANRLKAAADSFANYVDQTIAAIDGWEPNAQDAFTAMVTMTPTMSEYFGNWKESRYVTGSTSTETRFVAHSRLIDVMGILTSLRTIYAGVAPLIKARDAAAAQQIDKNYSDLFNYVEDLHTKEGSGTKFTPDQAELFGNDAQQQAEAVVGQVTQAAALLNITLDA
jgi:hypothetical protein